MYLGFSICQIEDIGDTNFFRSWWESPWSEDVVSEGEVRADQPNWSVGLTGATESLQTGLGQSQSRKKLRVITVRMPRWPQIHVTKRGVVRSIAVAMGVNMEVKPRSSPDGDRAKC